MIVGTAGHIDHGKTSLIRALTGIDTDRLQEERRRGITIDLGYAYSPLHNGDVLGFVDVPGHQRLVHTMVAGVGGIDYAMLVIAADDGVMPQTREHLAILESSRNHSRRRRLDQDRPGGRCAYPRGAGPRSSAMLASTALLQCTALSARRNGA